MEYNILCRFCGETDKAILRTHKINHYKNGATKTYYCCRPCNKKRASAYRKTPSGKISVAKSVKKYNSKNLARKRAWEKCFYLGSKPCEKCGEPKTDKHHPDISEPLVVVWLCRLHHKEIHRNKV